MHKNSVKYYHLTPRRGNSVSLKPVASMHQRQLQFFLAHKHLYISNTSYLCN